ncbi:hypothetical protein LCGC14_0929500 [marine sediment metagenome]|uniref:Uncharacterized protein n=1 Tax=marine sediment metagenome TaxID=412755 RepID=A0A0F9NNE0_9ZZZZ
MIKKPTLDSIDKRLLHMRRLFNIMKAHKRHPLMDDAFKSLKREARSLDSMMREAVKSGDVEFRPREKKV